MPRYTVRATHGVILEAEIPLEAPNLRRAREIAQNMYDRGTFGVVAWEVKDSSVTNWQAVPHNVEIEVVEE